MRYTALPRPSFLFLPIFFLPLPSFYQHTEAYAYAQLSLSFSTFVPFIDTAELYSSPTKKETQGLTEEYIGNWLQKRGGRDELIIASKIAGDRPFAQHIRPQLGYSKTNIKEAVDLSLRRLKTDYLDLYQLHWPNRQTNFFGERGYTHDTSEAWEDDFLERLDYLDCLVKSGKIRYIGVSNETPWGLMRYLHLAEKHDLVRCVTIQNPYSLLNRIYEIGLAEISMREDVPLLPYSPLGAGMLSGKYHLKTDKPENRLNKYPNVKRYSSSRAWEATERYLKLAQENDLSLTQMALAYVNDRPFVGSNIIGATSLEQLEENLDSIDLILSDELIAAIDEIHNDLPNPAP